MSSDAKAGRKTPGEKPEGKFHYNPGNMSGKSADICKDANEQKNNVDRIESRKPSPKRDAR